MLQLYLRLHQISTSYCNFIHISAEYTKLCSKENLYTTLSIGVVNAKVNPSGCLETPAGAYDTILIWSDEHVLIGLVRAHLVGLQFFESFITSI